MTWHPLADDYAPDCKGCGEPNAATHADTGLCDDCYAERRQPELSEVIRRHDNRAELSRRRGNDDAALFWERQATQARALLRGQA